MMSCLKTLHLLALLLDWMEEVLQLLQLKVRRNRKCNQKKFRKLTKLLRRYPLGHFVIKDSLGDQVVNFLNSETIELFVNISVYNRRQLTGFIPKHQKGATFAPLEFGTLRLVHKTPKSNDSGLVHTKVLKNVSCLSWRHYYWTLRRLLCRKERVVWGWK